MTNIFEAR